MSRMSESNGMLPDGSNPEFTDPVPALGWKTKDDIKDVVVYGMPISPMVAKLLCMLQFAEIPYTLKEGTSKPDSDYKKMPVIDVAGRQVNDTYIIFKHLAPILFKNEWDAELEKQLTMQLAPSIEYTMGTEEFKSWAGGRYGFGIPDFMLWMLGWAMYEFMIIKPNIDKSVKEGLVEVREPKDVLSDFKKKMKGEFHGGAKPGSADITVYGILMPWIYKELPSVKAAISDAGLDSWVEAMKAVVPLEKIYPAE